MKISYGTLILPSLLPRIYSVLQALYFGAVAEMESKFNSNVRRLRSMNDLCLAQYVGSDILEQIIIKADNKPVFASAIGLLRTLPLQVLPDFKLDLICDLFRDIKQQIKPRLENPSKWLTKIA